jgi:hypothetical protein
MDEKIFLKEKKRLQDELNKLETKYKIEKSGLSEEEIENLKRHISVKVKEGSGMGSSWADAYVYYDDILIAEQNIYSY